MPRLSYLVLEFLFIQNMSDCLSIGLLSVSSNKLVARAGTVLWKGPSSSSAFYGSTDASLFSSSLPVIRHGKCMQHFSYVELSPTTFVELIHM